MFTKEMEIKLIRKNQTEILGVKNTATELEKSTESFNSKLNQVEENQ